MIFARTTTLMILAGVLAAAPAAWGRTHDELQAPRGQDVQAPREQEVQAPRGDEIQRRVTSPLKQIDQQTVKKLRVVWSWGMNDKRTESQPLVPGVRG